MDDQVDPAEPPQRVCSKCSVQSQTQGAFCPNCGAPYVKGNSREAGKKKLLVGALIVLLFAGIGSAFVLKNQHDEQVKDDRAAAAAASEAADEQREANNKASAEEAEREVRKEQIKSLESYIKKDAKKNVNDGLLDGPILSASCIATGAGSSDDLTALTGTFDCMAVNKENGDGTSSGYSYAGSIDWQSGEFTWQLGG